MKMNPIQIILGIVVAMALCASNLYAQADCSAVQNDVKAKIAALDRADPDFQAKAVKIAEDAMAANSGCGCEIFQGAADGFSNSESAAKMAVLDAIMALVPESQRQALGDCCAADLNSDEINQMQDRWGVVIGQPGDVGYATYRLDGSQVFLLTPGARGGGGGGGLGAPAEEEAPLTVSATVVEEATTIIIVPPPTPTSPPNP